MLRNERIFGTADDFMSDMDYYEMIEEVESDLKQYPADAVAEADALRRDAADPGHIAQPGNQHGSFATARHRQQQHRAVDGLHRGPLLGVQRRHMGGFKGGFVHSAAPSFIE